MMKNFILNTVSYLLVAVMASVATFAFCRYRAPGKLESLQNLLEQRYIGEMDEKKVEDAAAAAMVDALGDRWSHYQSAEIYELYQNVMSNTYVGVGMAISVSQDGQGLDITQVEDEGPAQKAGVRAGDRLVAVDGTDIRGMTLSEAGKLLKGEEGTSVVLTVVRDQQTLELSVERGRLKSVVTTGQLLPEGVGLITIANFDDRCAEETVKVIEQLRQQGATALVFDVRNNPGGYKRELVELLDYLLPEGPLFRTVDYRGKERVDTSDAQCLELPMAVLVNENSYSAAEFFAVALHEYDWATVVGTQTSGKGHYQVTYRLSDGSAVGLSIGKYFTPSGVSLEGVGITPGVYVEVDDATFAAIYYGTLDPMEDPQILSAINALKTWKSP
jgi:carboxyl-terminal processing protease